MRVIYVAHKNILICLFQGINQDRNFKEWLMKPFPAEIQAREFLKKHNVEHYWDIALSQSLQEDNEEFTG